jgi:hypothetical protein
MGLKLKSGKIDIGGRSTSPHMSAVQARDCLAGTRRLGLGMNELITLDISKSGSTALIDLWDRSQRYPAINTAIESSFGLHFQWMSSSKSIQTVRVRRRVVGGGREEG